MIFITPAAASAAEPSAEDVKFFETKIRPLLLERCAECHGPDEQESELRLDTYAGMMAGGTSGAVLVPGNAAESLLMAAVGYQDEHLQMPPDGKLADAEIELLKLWIDKGAPHPDQNGPVAVEPRRGPVDLNEARKHWAFQPVVRPEIPGRAAPEWVQSPIDALLWDQLRAAGLRPAPPADKRTLIRRATFDLIGLPPTPEEIDDFVADDSPNAFERVVDRLLASEHFGEHWARHWLDVVRYADSNGQDENAAHGNAWRYRDWVVDALNADMPFDRFITEQIAGDLYVREEVGGNAAPSSNFGRLIATGYLALGPKVLEERDLAKQQMDIIDEQIDTLGQSLLGLTLACARCHDHKFDPISTEDYYALAGIFKSTKTMENRNQWLENLVAPPEELEAKRRHDEKIAAKEAEIKNAKADVEKLRAELKTLQAATPLLPSAMGVQEGTIEHARVNVRGSHLTLGKTVPRGIPAVLAGENPLQISESESGRRQLARWLVSPNNPLTPRVAMNRIWRWHFGRGLVSTTNNFGKLGEPPTHPQLLDWLAAEFVAQEWSLKKMHRQIMLSSTYQMSSQSIAENEAIDPDNRQHWRANLQRLEAESIRDSLLAVSGLLDKTRGGSLLLQKNRTLIFNHTSQDATSYDHRRRSLYLPIVRNNLYDGFSLFDYTNADSTEGSRETSTVASQALYMMNSDMLFETASALASRLIQTHPSDEAARVVRLYESALGRTPQPDELSRFLAALDQFETNLQEESWGSSPRQRAWTAGCQCILALNEFIYVR